MTGKPAPDWLKTLRALPPSPDQETPEERAQRFRECDEAELRAVEECLALCGKEAEPYLLEPLNKRFKELQSSLTGTPPEEVEAA